MFDFVKRLFGESDPLAALTVAVQESGGKKSKLGWLTKLRLTGVIRKVLLPAVRQNIVIHITGGERAKPIKDGYFHLFVDSVAKGSSTVSLPAKVWGQKVTASSDEHAFQPSGLGTPIFNGNSSFAVAELVNENCLYLLWNMVGAGTEQEMALLSHVLTHIVQDMDVDNLVKKLLQELAPDTISSGEHTEAVFDDGFKGRRSKVVKSLLLQTLIPVVGQDIFVRDCQGELHEPLSDGMFHVFFWSAPLGVTWSTDDKTMFGCELLSPSDVFAPSGSGVPILDEQGEIAGELLANNLYLNRQYLPYGSTTELKLLLKLFLKVRQELLAGKTASDAEKCEAAFSGECIKQIDACLSNTKKIALNTSALNKLQSELADNLRQTRKLELKLYQTEEAKSIGQEFDELVAVPKVLNVRFNNDSLIVTTAKLYCVDPRTGLTHEIGAFEIFVPMSNTSQIRWFNLDRKVRIISHDGHPREMNAPHVAEGGKHCEGNTKDLFPNLIKRREYAIAAALAIAFVESVDVKDLWGSNINKWPIAALADDTARIGQADLKSYLVPSLTDQQKQLLADAGVEFSNWGPDLIIEHDQLIAALKSLKATASPSPTEFDNLIKLSLTFGVADTIAGTVKTEPSEEQKAALAKVRAQYIKACSARLSSEIESVKSQLDKSRSISNKQTAKFVKLCRQKRFGSNAATASSFAAQFAKELQNISRIRAVTSVRVIDGVVLVNLDTLKTVNPANGAIHELGKFQLYIRLGGDEPGVYWFNCSRRVNGVRTAMNAPTIYGWGGMCAHELKATLLELIGTLELATLVELAIQFVEQVENDEFGKHINNWPAQAA